MDENKSLLISADSESTPYLFNKGGRPSMAKIIKFSPQPKSLIITHLINQTQEKDTQDFQEEKATRATTYLEVEDVDVIANQITSERCKDRQYSCDYPNCTYTCKLSCNLIKHKRIHTAEKQYLCDQCTFHSNFVNSLKVHKRIHTAERPYGCKHCQYRCNSSSNLKKHCLHRHPEVPKT